MTEADRLTALDTAFLDMERAGAPLHVTSVALFDAGPLLDERGDLRLDELRAEIAGRLDALPRLRRRLAWTPLDVARPCWVDDTSFDIAEHVDAVALRAGSDDRALQRYAERAVVEPLPLDRPLWHVRFVTGLSHRRVALIERVHHALVDGVSGVDVASVVLEMAPVVSPPRPVTWRPTMPPFDDALLVAGLRSRLAAPLRAAQRAASLLREPEELVRRAGELATGVSTVAGDGMLAPRRSINAPIGSERRLAWIRTSLADIRDVSKPACTTVNDVVLSAVASGMRALLLHRREVVGADDVLKVLVPVSLRDATERDTLGNRVSALLLRLPIGIGDAAERLRAIAAETARLKARREATTTDLLLGATDLLPPRLARRVVGTVATQPFVNLVVTNVPGPQVPLFLHGARMLEVFPVVPLGGNLTVGVAVLSYDGALNLGITADADACPDIAVVRDGIVDGFAAHGIVATSVPAARHTRPARHPRPSTTVI